MNQLMYGVLPDRDPSRLEERAAFSANVVLVLTDQGHSHPIGFENCPLEHVEKAAPKGVNEGLDVPMK